LRVQKHRQKDKVVISEALQNVTKITDPKCNTAEQSIAVQRNTKKGEREPLSLADLVAYAKTKGISESDAEAFFNSQEAGGWTRGGRPLRDWKAALNTWKANGYLASQKQRPSNQFQKPKSPNEDRFDREYEEAQQKHEQRKHQGT
jgi:hypothetical protein